MTLPRHGDFEYLGNGYYECAEAEEENIPGLPSCEDVLDAYVVPLALERARLAGLPVPEWQLTNELFEAPAVLYGVNPFARNFMVVHGADERAAAARKMSRRGKFAMCCQRLPEGADLIEFDMVLGETQDERFGQWAADVYRVFRIPTSRVRLIRTGDEILLSAIERLPEDELPRVLSTLLGEQTLGGLPRG